jgi:hypothetical protein
VVPCRLGDDRVLDPRVREAVPRHVDKANEPFVVVASGDLSQAVPFDLVAPVPFGLREEARLECLRVELVQLGAVEAAAPVIGDAHDDDSPTNG